MRSILKVAVLGFSIIISQAVLAQQSPLLELPNMQEPTPKISSENKELELLSPNEIYDLYDGQTPAAKTKSVEPTIANESIAEKEAKSIESSYSRLVNELNDDSNEHDDDNQEYNIDKLWTHKSVMLLPNEVKIFNAALGRYAKSLLKPIFEAEVQEEEVEQVAAEVVTKPVSKIKYPFISLNSIMYKNPNEWAVWINRKRYFPYNREALDGIKVSSVSKNTATIIWKPVAAETENTANDINLDNSLDGSLDEGITLEYEDDITQSQIDNTLIPSTLPANVKEREDGSYAITLSSNQVFISDDFTTHEGHAATTRINNIYQAHLREKRQTADSTAKVTINSSAGINTDPVEQQAQQDINQLLELYKESGETALPSR